ncbi:MAG: ubiquinone/menaquinone biosynthesis C-methylase UbiE [Candidatus Omnitrophota bacterium]|jgi:ubiquinone/menaquinone biosynthesis C-methylase UbiE
MTNFYDETYYKNTITDPTKAKAFQAAKEREFEFLKEQLSPKSGKKLLDLGCGVGKYLQSIAPSGADLWGIDISKIATDSAKKCVKKPEQIICSSSMPLPFEDNTFDYVTAWGVIEHFPCIPSILKEITRITKKDAEIVIMVPNAYFYRFILNTWHKGTGPTKHQEPEMLYAFAEWKRMIEKTSLEVTKTNFHNKFNKPKWEWLRNILIPFYFSNHFVYVCRNTK